MDRSLAGVPAQAIELGRRQRDVRILSEVMVLTEQRLRQEELRQALTFANVQVIDPPELLPRPVWPRKKLGLLVAIMLGGGFALLGMVVVERADGAVRSAEEIRRIAGAPVLATPVRVRDGDYAFHGAEARAVLQKAVASGTGARLVILAPVDDRVDPGALRDALLRDGEGAPDTGSVSRIRGARAATPLGAGPSGSGPPDGGGNGPGGVAPRPPSEGAASHEQVEVVAAAPLDRVGTAAEAAARGGAVVLVGAYGRTGAARLASGVSLRREVGEEAEGVVVVCDGEKEVRAAWRR